MDKETVKDIQRSIAMKLNRVEYTEVPLISGYADAEDCYKKFRDGLKKVSDSITWLMTYEHGGSKMKSLYSKMNMITSTSRLGNFKNYDIYELNGLVGLELSRIGLASNVSDIGRKYSKAHMDISRYKLEMNKKLEQQIKKISELRDHSNAIDKKRKKVSNIRYDLEMMKKSKDPKAPDAVSQESEMEKTFKETSKEVLKEMERFIGNDGVCGVLQSVAEAHREFSEKSSKVLGEVK
ncbi:hypothetical protein EHEL_010280 [Encephalitozoon hellem ATCC 50504]|uniref:Spore wall protein 12 n=1 Tax=Encephalitozoon hellem TaxID=27973 RepID=A0A9Q9C1J1_ENCHE|nr:uncharacterized protein EHEL_010280 [Encephalitozoon hellem ATCC 50504]AFM97652.1 hypothetical protein EHEL_010280 [Encephalitozoon hellem ATCC 50504]UTX42341.1 spore wall protein 12 [Encephalitozoon hellem]WEL37783.1 spore wall protein 12 [Encephalitozoon hellem]|eukprot:XP_003886633.1 hypothetical protein EHEL_010280 [Encephalitozoon hellem ATCC 50504]